MQGRSTRYFTDFNEDLIARLEARYPALASMEMETGHIFDLARSTAPGAPRIYASGAAMVIANRHRAEVLSKAALVGLEEVGGRAALAALAKFTFPEEDEAAAAAAPAAQ